MLKKFGVTLITEKLAEVRSFYETYLEARSHFDCGWYVNLILENQAEFELCLMIPQSKERDTPLFSGGITLNLQFDNVEGIYQRCLQLGAPIFMPLEDHPWGDRGFSIKDPIGSIVYCYHLIPPAEEFQSFFEKKERSVDRT
jgi:dihydroorotase-like cyclic amidohydrolase